MALLGQNLTLADYVDLLEMCQNVLDKFSALFRTRQLVAYSVKQSRKVKEDLAKESVLELLLSFVKCNSVTMNIPSRNIYDEFFEVPHECHPNQTSPLTFPWLPTIKEFLDAVSQISCDEPWLSGLPGQTTTFTQEEWTYKILSQESFSRPLILVGCLGYSSNAGQLRLLDQTGEINCMIAPKDENPTEHDCAKNCCEKATIKEQCSRCPFSQTRSLSAMIQINKFEVVVEKFHSRGLVQEDLDRDRNRLYVQFSFDDTEILIPKHESKVEKYCTKRTNRFEAGTTDANLERELNGNLESKSDCFVCKVIFMVRNCEVPMLRRLREEVCYPCGVEIKVVAVYKSITQDVSVTNDETSEEVLPCGSNLPKLLSDFKLQEKNAALKLEKKSLYLAHVLHPGCFYVMTEIVPDEKQSRLIQNGDLQVLISVSSDVLLERICWCERCDSNSPKETESSCDIIKALTDLKEDFLKNDTLLSVDSVLGEGTLTGVTGNETSLKQSRPSSTQVSFHGLIISRDLRQSDCPSQRLPNDLVELPKFGPVKMSVIKDLQLGFTLLENKIIQLRVRDLDSPNTISVYLDFRKTSYIDGILPGAIVRFRRLVRKFSRTRNMYCTFEACSSIFVKRRAAKNLTSIQPTPQFSFSIAASSSNEALTKELPNQCLIRLIQSEAQGRFVQTISRVRCRVIAVQRASLRWLCKRCGELVARNECAACCFCSPGYKLNAEARCVVEDGTGEAQVYVYDDLVPTLLRLSDQQWHHLQDLAMRSGELLYQRQWYGARGRVKTNLNEGSLSRETEAKLTWEYHCVSSQVSRRIVLQGKLFRFRKDGANNTEQGKESRNITVGSTEHSTLVLPKLLLRAVSIAEVRATEEIRQLLQQGRDGLQ